MAINEWSTTASSNASGVTNVNWAEGQAPSTVNDSARNLMADVATWYGQASGKIPEYLTSVSGTNTITATGPAAMSAYAAGQRFTFIPAATNTGATTINITPSGASALGAKNVFSYGAACIGGEIKISVPVEIIYDGTQFNLLGPAAAVSGAASSLVSAQTISNQASVIFTIGSADWYELACTKVIPQTDNTTLQMQVSTDGGSTYLSTNEYRHARPANDTSPAATALGATGDTKWTISTGLGTSTGEHLNCVLNLQNFADTSVYKGYNGTAQIYDQSGSHLTLGAGGTVITTSAITHVKLTMSSGNINGKFALYVRRTS